MISGTSSNVHTGHFEWKWTCYEGTLCQHFLIVFFASQTIFGIIDYPLYISSYVPAIGLILRV